MSVRRLVGCAAIALGGCVPSLDGADRVLVYDYVGADLTLAERDLGIAADDLVRGESPQARILIGGEMEVLPRIAAHGGRAPNLPARVEDGVLIPGDADALAFFSFLVHLQTAGTWFLDLEMADARLFDGLEARYEVFFPFATEWRDLADNAGYFAITHDFLLGPSEIAPGVPVMASPGVVAHELSHAVQAATGDRDSLRFVCLGDSSLASCRTMAGMDEGLADLWAVALVGDPDFVTRNFGDLVVGRDLRDLKALSPELALLTDGAQGNNELDLSLWDSHPPGAIWASWWWAIGQELDGGLDRVVELTWGMTLRVGALRRGDLFGVVEMLDAFLVGATADERATSCAVITEVLEADLYRQVQGCD